MDRTVFQEPTELGGGASWRHALHGARLMELLAPDAWAAGVGHRARAEHYSMAYQESPFHLLLGHYDVVVRSSLTSFSPSFFPSLLPVCSLPLFCLFFFLFPHPPASFPPFFLSFRSILLPACLYVLPDLLFFNSFRPLVSCLSAGLLLLFSLPSFVLFLGFPHEPLSSSSPLSRPASFSCCLPGPVGLFLRSPRGVSPAPSPPSLPSSPPSSLSVTLLRSPLTSGCLSAASPERLEGGLVVDRRVQLCVGVWEVSVRFSEYSAPLAGSHRP